MSIQAMVWALRQRIVKNSKHRHVLLVLGNYAGEDGRGAFPSAKTLCEETGLSESTVRRALSALEEMGCIRRGNQAIVVAWGGRADRLPVLWDFPALADAERGVALTPREKSKEKEAKKRPVTVTPRKTNGVSEREKRGVTVTPKPFLYPSKTTTTASALIWDSLPQLSSEERGVVVDQLKGFTPDRQQDVLDELAGALRTKAIKGQWPGWLHGVVKNAVEGNFKPNHALAIQAERKQRIESQQLAAKRHAEAEERKARNSDPAYQAKQKAASEAARRSLFGT